MDERRKGTDPGRTVVLLSRDIANSKTRHVSFRKGKTGAW